MSDFQRKAVATGKAYEERVERWLAGQGFEIIARHHRHESGVEFDLLCRSPLGNLTGVECKASDDDATRPGMERSDNVWKVCGYLYLLLVWSLQQGAERPDYMLVTSHMPAPATRWSEVLRRAQALGHIRIIELPYEATS